MITEKIYISEEEEKILISAIGKKLNLISTEDNLNFNEDFIWEIYCDFGEFCIKIEREDIVAKLFDMNEDGGKFLISKLQPKNEHKIITKTINRIVQNVSVCYVTVKFSNYEITYPKAIIFNFKDCNLVIEKAWIFSLAGFMVRLELSENETFGFIDELSFWYDSDEDEE